MMWGRSGGTWLPPKELVSGTNFLVGNERRKKGDFYPAYGTGWGKAQRDLNTSDGYFRGACYSTDVGQNRHLNFVA